MAAGAMPIPPPGGAPPQMGTGPTQPINAAPAPADISPQLDRASGLLLQLVQGTRLLGQIAPQIEPVLTQINDLWRQAGLLMQQGAQPTEPAAPPMGG